MAATKEDVDRWITRGKKENYKYIISVCDTFDWSDYPVYCKDYEELSDNKKYYKEASMQKINEIIKL